MWHNVKTGKAGVGPKLVDIMKVPAQVKSLSLMKYWAEEQVLEFDGAPLEIPVTKMEVTLINYHKEVVPSSFEEGIVGSQYLAT